MHACVHSAHHALGCTLQAPAPPPVHEVLAKHLMRAQPLTATPHACYTRHVLTCHCSHVSCSHVSCYLLGAAQAPAPPPVHEVLATEVVAVQEPCETIFNYAFLDEDDKVGRSAVLGG